MVDVLRLVDRPHELGIVEVVFDRQIRGLRLLVLEVSSLGLLFVAVQVGVNVPFDAFISKIVSVDTVLELVGNKAFGLAERLRDEGPRDERGDNELPGVLAAADVGITRGEDWGLADGPAHGGVVFVDALGIRKLV